MLAWSGRGDGLVSLHDATTGAEVVRLVGHSAVVRGIAFAPDGRGLATGGADRTIKLWDVPASEPSLSLSAKALRGKPSGVRDEAQPSVLDRDGVPRAGRAVRAWRSGRTTATGRPSPARPGGTAARRCAGRWPSRSTACWPPSGPRPRFDPRRPPMTPSTCAGSTSTWSARSRRPPRRATSSTIRARTSARELVEVLLESPAYLTHATEAYRMLLLPEADTDGQIRGLTPTFEAWLRKKVAEEVGYDQIVREVLTVRLGSAGRRAGIAHDPRAEPSPLAYYVAKDAKPENLAAGTARTFLGIRLECAQCHNHPFDQWKREEFWGLAAFFAGVSKQGKDEAHGADPRDRRPPRAGDPRDQADRQGRVPRRQANRSGAVGRPGASSWPTG